jgi:hypothetical protein
MNERDKSELTDANGEPYDPQAALDAIANGNDVEGYDELWQRLHHQGDLGTAAYAAVPQLVRLMQGAKKPDWRAYALIATIDERRRARGNPSVPAWLSDAYAAAMRDVVESATEHLRLTDADLGVRSLIAAIAQPKVSVPLVLSHSGRRTSEPRCLASKGSFPPSAAIRSSAVRGLYAA